MRALHPAYVSVLGSVQQFAPALWVLAVAHHLPYADQVSVIADGADWIWNLVADLFPESIEIVDWYHARQHLAAAAQGLYPDNPQQAHHWFDTHSTDLFQGHVWHICDALEAAGLTDHSRYFRVHQRRMQYQEFRELGFPIGSGVAESAIKQFKARLSDPGMRWSRLAAERMLLIRAAILSDDFDRLWHAA